MMNIVWVLWALKIAGLTTIEYGTLGWLTAAFIVGSMILNAIEKKARSYTDTQILDKLEKEFGDDDEAGKLGLLMLIYKKLKG